eukprot:151664-Prymnesium_polylepis.1
MSRRSPADRRRSSSRGGGGARERGRGRGRGVPYASCGPRRRRRRSAGGRGRACPLQPLCGNRAWSRTCPHVHEGDSALPRASGPHQLGRRGRAR